MKIKIVDIFQKELNFGWRFVVVILILNFQYIKGRDILKIDNEGSTDFYINTKSTPYENEITNVQQPFNGTTTGSLSSPMKLCAFMNVSDNSSYNLFDREEFSEGLLWIHNTSDVFERFYSVEIEEGCEVTICELQLLNVKGRVRKCYTSGTPQWNDLNLQNTTNQVQTTKPKAKGPDPMTSQYFVSTGCSCQKPEPNCKDARCEDAILEEHECGRLYQETNCTECRYDAKRLNESELFSPSNTFWCQSFVIRTGCRLRIGSYNSEEISNERYYLGRNGYIEMDYVRYPYPSIWTCICDVDENAIEPYAYSASTINWVLPVVVFVVISMFAVGTAFVLYKCGVPLQVGKWKSQPNIEDVINQFQYGFTNGEVPPYDEDGNGYVSAGFLAAVQKPYQNKWEIPRESIKIDKKHNPLGIGQFGVVYLGILNETKVAVKTAKICSNMIHFSSILDEIKILAFIGTHPNICCLIGACTQNIQQKEALIILELCYQGNLLHYLLANKTSFLETPTFDPKNVNSQNGNYAPLSSLSMNMSDPNRKIKPQKWETLIKWCSQIACGMEFLCEKQVIHIDLAARNVLLTENLECKIGDFGLSQKIQDVLNYVRIGNEYPLPFRWMALESLTDLKFSHESDIWSYGVTLYEILSLGEAPFPDVLGVTALIDALSSGIRLKKPINCSDKIYQLMLQTWEAEPERRPTFTDLRCFFETLALHKS